MLMSKITIIEKSININKKHIDEFQLESEFGTKKLKEKFHKNAVIQRNKYVFIQQEKFDSYKRQVYKEMKNRVSNYLPIDNSENYNNKINNLIEMKDIINFTNSFSDGSYKLGLLSIISEIKEEADNSLDNINDILERFIYKFTEIGITLNFNDFSCSMFTEKYMKDYFRRDNDNNVDLKLSFESVYWECPNFLKHLKLNLWMILDKYKKEIDAYVTKVKNDKLSINNFSSKDVYSKYYDKLEELDTDISRDTYINLTNFLKKKKNISDYLENSSIRKSNFNLLTIGGNFDDLDSSSKNKFYLEIVDLAKTLSVLKNYYCYEFIVKDLQEKFNKRVENKNLYENKLKEIKNEENKRKKIYSSYLRATGIGFLARVDEKKISSCKLLMNEEVLKLYGLYNELHDLEIIYKMNKQLSDISSLYDLFMLAYSSYYYLEKVFKENFKDAENFSITGEINKYFDFIYNPANFFLTKINAFSSYDIAEIISDKYRLLELNITKNSIVKDSLDSTIDTVNFIKLIKDISDSNLSLDKMNFIVKFREFGEVNVDDGDVEFLQD